MMEQPTEQHYFAGSDWGDDVIAAWLASFYELAGELDISKHQRDAHVQRSRSTRHAGTSPDSRWAK